jgi:Mn2+/Fe2+ NRAMP family transporter
MQSLFWSAIINGVLAPFLLAGILMAARDPVIMEKRPSSPLNQLVVGITTLAMFAACFIMLYGAWAGRS